ncbi:GAF and ANTAR domain-containing protein [Streptomyces sp. MBT58]|uniref:GAF and ANTAR domain-containing protein n=1 Tax=Streptomyces sp. MBT58 TaxID=1488389 RepID=UPI0019114FBF|nr:GAF and ANTAR domain-containing protein [Streptomyces sp. MBT58]MBK5990392.1 GAF and ANTAR domain-containing protein [Streptomyces sp. MBT58]
MDWRDFAQRLGVMAHDLLAQESVDATLERITGAATELVEGCDAAGILVLVRGEAVTLAPSQPMAAKLDQLQYELGEGPCFDAVRAAVPGRVFRVADVTGMESRWPDFVPAARDLGVGSIMGFLLSTGDEEFGALNFYSQRPGAFTETSEAAGVVLASHAAVAISSARSHAQLEEAIATRHQIGEAMGILMARHRITGEQAFNVLRRYSQDNNTKLRDVARQVSERGALT